jgi:hypothetical protein
MSVLIFKFMGDRADASYLQTKHVDYIVCK